MRVRGTVQGVGFRPFVYRLAREVGATGWVWNDTEGVLLQVEARPEALEEFLRRLRSEAPPLASVDSVEPKRVPLSEEAGFRVLDSPQSGPRRAIVPPDVATCADCLAEMEDPADRRYRYPFLNCTNCGPRFSIIESLPYDRPRTSMKRFRMCPECEREYHDPTNRRFHAQPTACAACGPSVAFESPEGDPVAVGEEAIAETIRWLKEGRILAFKGLGGFQLLADAGNDDAVAELRRRKRRGRKPFAVMFPDLAGVASVAEVDAVSEGVLRSAASPIVLLDARSGAGILAPSVAPGNPLIGAMVPYSPLHHLVLKEARIPLVATSGNLSDEPICIDNEEARERLRELADGFLVHDRPIVRPVDDSVVRVVRGRLQVLRRARGYSPLALSFRETLPAVLAVGPQLKCTVAVALGDRVVVSQHLGDLDNAETFGVFRRSIDDLCRFYDWAPEAVAHDLHPDYLSTRHARDLGLPLRPVQHHYAHVLSCLADAEVAPPVLGVAWDGTGYGTDGTIWGGEFLRLTDEGFERVAHLRTFPLLGGDAAIREPRRSAAGLLYELWGERAFDGHGPALEPFAPGEGRTIATLLRRSVRVVRTSSAGRLFDGVASILGLVHKSDFEGEAAMAVEFAAGPASADRGSLEPYPFRLERTGDGTVLDWGPMLEAMVKERHEPPRAARRFHATLASGIVAVAREVGLRKVALTGGCFQNRRLTELALDGLTAEGFEPVWHARVPPNDGGISVGQVLAAARVMTVDRVGKVRSVQGSTGGDHVSRDTGPG